jgi:hypothetical protein
MRRRLDELTDEIAKDTLRLWKAATSPRAGRGKWAHAEMQLCKRLAPKQGVHP